MIKSEFEAAPATEDELETTFFRLIVSGPRLMAPRANGPRTLARTHGDVDAFVIGTESGVLINESGKAVTTI
jgi:hypothetical protein